MSSIVEIARPLKLCTGTLKNVAERFDSVIAPFSAMLATVGTAVIFGNSKVMPSPTKASRLSASIIPRSALANALMTVVLCGVGIMPGAVDVVLSAALTY